MHYYMSQSSEWLSDPRSEGWNLVYLILKKFYAHKVMAYMCHVDAPVQTTKQQQPIVLSHDKV